MAEPSVCIGSMLEPGDANGGNSWDDFKENKKAQYGVGIAILLVIAFIIIMVVVFKDKFYGGDPVNEWNLSNLLYYQKPNGVIGGPQ
jgi:hypothetical protein